ncbi:alpha-amylase family glycosyl hydrolase [Tropicimonas sp. TH_r6]|uniref:alpha-amylase family glycosyl hydrolase n=1 Tax=Tropicimonas sp. TH_r6 TaxID=3082085 RepID=UPI0029532434|nr:alpha-amylase family glycosyl hydrolase [Tropicimonas sp. TH_r6]MDV7142659.1 alpha-amylase family glycosyl hydrolase [Tropicimonas sp. TH_r6]
MDIHYESRKTLDLVLSETDLSALPARRRAAFINRLKAHFPALFEKFLQLYGSRYDAYVHIRNLVETLAAHQVEEHHAGLPVETDRPWYLGEDQVGMAVYVDLFGGDLKGMIARIPYLESLGITYLHLMPLYEAPTENSDGGYAVSDYRKVDKRLGSNKDLKALADALHKRGIRLVLDFVFNHTSDEHAWAKAALAGDPRYRQFYYLLDEPEARAYDATLREIFPTVRRGSFTWSEAAGKWVWTTFNSFQWDLNYSNPDVFVSVVGEMLHLVAMGADVLRLDALAFVWKELGTVCESLPKAHTVIQTFNLCLRIAAPHVHFKSEAIVHPDQVNAYIGLEECELSYNPLMMALMWESLATRRTELLNASLDKSFSIPDGTVWVNYIRCHDDIGWTWDDAISGRLGISGGDHRGFLNRFYTGRFDGSFADGVPFQENPSTGDCRVCGTLASLTGVESAAAAGNTLLLDHALRRVKLLHGIVLSMPGLPLLYQGDDLGVVNDHSYLDRPGKAEDSRWVHRKQLSEQDFANAADPRRPQARIATELAEIITLRKAHGIFAATDFELLRLDSPHVFAFLRRRGTERLLVLANFSEHGLPLNLDLTDVLGTMAFRDMLDPEVATTPVLSVLDPYALHWFHAAG